MKNHLLLIGSLLSVVVGATNPVLSGFNHLSRPADARIFACGGTLMRLDLNSGSNFVSSVHRLSEPTTVFGLNVVPTMVAGQPNSRMGTVYGASSLGSGTISGGLRYYQAGSVLVRDNEGNELGTVEPYVVDFGLQYSLLLTDRVTMGTGLRYVFSDLYQGQENSAKLSTVNFDLSWLFMLSENSDIVLQVSEIGPKINSENGAVGFSPTRFRLGYLNTAKLGKQNLHWSLQVEKILAPTAPILDANGNVVSGRAVPNSFFAPIFTSWTDAPGGMAEELDEFRPSIGLAYELTDGLAIRTGYSLQSIEKGSMNFLGMGLSYATSSFRLDAGYSLGMATLTNPMNNHIQLGLAYQL
jgi:hypothetical protein